MSPIDLLPENVRELYEVREWNHACAILKEDFPNEWADMIAVFGDFRLHRSQIVKPGGSKTDIAGALDREFSRRGWKEMSIRTRVVVEETEIESRSHKIDCYKNHVGLEIEWNSKDQTFDRDLLSFRSLFDLHRLSVGVIITRCDHLQDIFDRLGVGKKYGASTTHMGKLIPRIEAGRAGGCPVLVFGISDKLYVEE